MGQGQRNGNLGFVLDVLGMKKLTKHKLFKVNHGWNGSPLYLLACKKAVIYQ